MRHRVLLVIAAIASAFPVLTLDTASAASGDQYCEAGEVCLYQSTIYTGNAYTHPNSASYWSPTGPSYILYNGTATRVDNNTESIKNRGSATWRVLVYENRDYSGKVICLPAGAQPASLPGGYGNLDPNTASAHKWLSGGSC